MPCERPTCYQTRGGKCMNPNAWILFLKNNGGNGLTRPQLKQMYEAWKGNNFPSNSTVASRREVLCTQLIGPLHHVTEMVEREQRIAREAKDLKRREEEIVQMSLQDEQGRQLRRADRRASLREKGRKAILMEARRRKALIEKEKAKAFAKKRAALHAKAIRALKKDIREKRKRIIQEKKRERDSASRETIAMMKEDVRRTEKRLDTALNLRDIRRKALKDSLFTDSPSTIAKKRSALVSKTTPRNLGAMEQRTEQLNLVTSAENALLRGCGINESHLGVSYKTFPRVTKRRSENICEYIQRVFGMKDTYPTETFDTRQRFLVYRGVQTSGTSVFIKVSLVSEHPGRSNPVLENHNGPISRSAIDMTPIQEFLYKSHVHQSLDKLFRGVPEVSVPRYYASGLSLIGTGSRAQYAGLEVVETVPGVTLLEYAMSEDPNRWDPVLWKMGKVLRAMHAKGVAHGDFHLGNVMYDSHKKKITPIDLERSINFSEYKRSEGTVKKSLQYDLTQAYTSIASMVRLRVVDESTHESVTERIFDRFTRGYLGTKAPLTSSQMIWKHIKHGSVSILQAQYLNNYFKVLSGAMDSHWGVAKRRPIRLLENTPV